MANITQYVFLESPAADESISSTQYYETTDNDQFLASVIPEVNAKHVVRDDWIADVPIAIIPYTDGLLKRMSSHPNIMSLIGLVRQDSMRGPFCIDLELRNFVAFMYTTTRNGDEWLTEVPDLNTSCYHRI